MIPSVPHGPSLSQSQPLSGPTFVSWKMGVMKNVMSKRAEGEDAVCVSASFYMFSPVWGKAALRYVEGY